MPGIFISSDSLSPELKNLCPERCLAETLPAAGMTVKRHTLRKFLADKAFEKVEGGIVISEGVILNKTELFEAYGADSTATLIWKMYREKGETFPRELRGPFACAVYEEEKELWLVYTNQIGDASIYYTVWDGKFYAGSQPNYVIDACREKNIPLTFDGRAGYEMLTFGFMEGVHTYANEIRRLRGGTYLRAGKDGVEVKEYFTFHRNPDRFAGISLDDAAKEIDKAFRRAVALEYDKDDEYGYRYLADLSGGMDSRMAAWVAHELKPRHIQFLTYCRSFWLDEKIAREIAAYWGDEILIKSLDDTLFLKDIDVNVFANGGETLYSAITGGRRALESLNTEMYGLEHTGQIGDAIVGSFCKCVEDVTSDKTLIMFSDHLKDRLPAGDFAAQFDDNEIYTIYMALFGTTCNSHQIRRNYTEPVSPFLDVDFIQVCLDLPVEYRLNRRLYNYWMLTLYPEASKFRYEATGGFLTDSRVMKFIHRLRRSGMNKLHTLMKHPEKATNHMNPMNYWMRKGTDVRAYMDEYEKNGYAYLPENIPDTLIEDMKALYARGDSEEMAMVLTLQAACRLYFGTEK